MGSPVIPRAETGGSLTGTQNNSYDTFNNNSLLGTLPSNPSTAANPLGLAPGTPTSPSSLSAPLPDLPAVTTQAAALNTLNNNLTSTLIPNPNTAANTPPAGSGSLTPISATQTQALMSQILNSGTGVQNPLNPYFQTNYVWRLFMTQDIDPYIAGSKSNPAMAVNSGPALNKVTDNINQITIAQSGVTTYNIRSVEIDSVVGPESSSRNMNAVGFTIVVVEPMGVGFMEAVLAAATKLQIKNHTKVFYYLELQFLAYDTNGTPVTNPFVGQPGSLGANRWIWQIDITTVDIQLDAGGGTYTINAMPSAISTAASEDYFRVPETVNVTGSTLNDFTTNLAKALNDSWLYRYGNQTATYAFVWHDLTELGVTPPPGVGISPRSYSLKSTTPDYSTQRGLTIDTASGTPIVKMQTGMTIPQLIDAVLGSTEEAQKLAKDDPKTAATPTNPGFRKSIVWRIEPDVQLQNFEAITQQYYKVITYHIRPYYTQQPIIDTQQPIDAASPQASYNAMQDLIAKGLMSKHYDYIYTGLNTEILEFDIKYSFTWSVELARAQGTASTIDTAQYHARVNPANPPSSGGYQEANLTAQFVSVQAQQLHDAFLASSAQVQKAQSISDNIASLKANNPNDPEIATQTAALNNVTGGVDLTTLKAQNVAIAQQSAQFAQINALNNSTPQVTSSAGSKIYAEMLLANQQPTTVPDSYDPDMPISFIQKNFDAQDNAGTGVLGQYHRDRSVFGQVLGQLYQPDSSALNQIELTVRGDPYWIGYSSLDRMADLRQSATTFASSAPTPMSTIANWYGGGVCFVLRFRAPLEINSDDFTPVFKDSLVFSGVYQAVKVRNSFSDGIFKQTITAVRLPLINIFNAAGVTPAGQSSSGGASSNPATDLPQTGNNTPSPSSQGGSTPVNWYTSTAAQPYLNTINAAAAQYNVPPQLLAWQIGQESSFNPNAVGAGSTSSGVPVGIAQFTTGPNGTAQNVPGYGPLDPTDPNASIMAAAAYDQYLYNKNGQNWQTALTKYGTLSGNPSQSTWNGFYAANSAGSTGTNT